MAEGQGRLLHGVFSQGEPADTPRDLALQRPRVNKPVNVGELLARMRIALRHRMQRKAEIPVLKVGGLEVDSVRHRATRAGAELKLTPKEFELLSFLAKHPGRVVTHKQILTAVWGPAHTEDQKHGAMIKSPKGFPIQSPYLSTVNRQAEIMLRIASEFGFTPASRSRIFSYSKRDSLLLNSAGEADDEGSG